MAEEVEDSGGMAARLNNLNIETAGTEEETAGGLSDALEMEVEEERGKKGDNEEGGTQRALGALEFLTKDAEPSGSTLVDARNGLNKLICLAMLWTVRHRWPAGTRFAFNCYRHWVKIILCQNGEPPVTILIREGVTQGDSL